VSYPNWSTFPYIATGAGESAKKNIAKDNFKLLKEGDPNGKFWTPAMSDAPLRGYNGRHEWFWEPGDEAHIFPLENLMEMYYKSIGRNSTLIMGLTPNPDGLMPEPDVIRLKEWGDEIHRRFGFALGSTSGDGKLVILKMERPTLVNHIIIQEDIEMGERIQKYQIEGRIRGKWKLLCEGESVGHKRIEKFESVSVDRIRLSVLNAKRSPLIRNLSAYFVKSIKK
jgi:alpha-L-fucosidase